MRTILKKLRLILHQKYNFKYDQIEPEVKFKEELGTDSREMFELINDLEREFEIEIDLEIVEEIKTLQNIIDYIENQLILKK